MQWQGRPAGQEGDQQELVVDYNIVMEGLRDMTEDQRNQIMELVNNPQVQEMSKPSHQSCAVVQGALYKLANNVYGQNCVAALLQLFVSWRNTRPP